jgi:hypothetical protein
MKVWFGQIYIEPGVSFPFSHLFQRRLSAEVTALVEPSSTFLKKYGSDFELIFRISAKQGLKDNEIKGPTVFRKAKDVEYSIFLPFDVINRNADAPKRALSFLLKGVCKVFDMLEIDKTRLFNKQQSLIEGICSDPTMLEEPSWNKELNETLARTLFEAFFDKNKRA